MHGCSIVAFVFFLMCRCAKCDAKNCTRDSVCGKNSRCINNNCACKDGFVSSKSTREKGTNCIETPTEGSDLSEGEIIGIVIGLIVAVLVLAVILAVVFYFKISRSCRPNEEAPRYQPANSSSQQRSGSENLSNKGQNRSDESLNTTKNYNPIK